MKSRGLIGWVGSRRRRFWILAAMILLPVLYFASFGPFLWFMGQFGVSDSVFDVAQVVYAPCEWIGNSTPRPVARAYRRYLMLWTGLVRFK